MKSDTQWPRFQVFAQEAEGKPHQDVGSVHAPDAELALLNARDVFARRPACISMWVAPVEAILSKTAEELEGWQPEKEENSSGLDELYLVFIKENSAGTQTLVGSLEAKSPQNALSLALTQFVKNKPPFAWWVIPNSRIKKSDPQDAESFFNPAEEKKFRLAADFKTLTAMQKIKRTAPKKTNPEEELSQ